MAELDIHYLTGLAASARNGSSDAFAEIFTATYERELQIISAHISNETRVPEILQEVYVTALERIHELPDPHFILSWLDGITEEACSAASADRSPEPPSDDNRKEQRHETSACELDPERAGRILTSVFASCGKPPSAVPVRTFMEWGNYTKHSFRAGKALCFAALAAMALLPLCFLHPEIYAVRTNIDSTQHAAYTITVNSLLPVTDVSAELDGSTVPLQKNSGTSYSAELDGNGTLLLSAVSVNGQTSSVEYNVNYIDSEKPELVNYYTKNGLVCIVVKDSYSGIDFSGITAKDASGASVSPVSCDKDTETITFSIPSSSVRVSIPDNAGNILVLVISPDNSVGTGSK